ncbi:serine/threonine-protein kinase ATG1a isoform X2 [Mercurialis annua]|uniref:serine/threonine-protein kinase ATG1a isoform X2 n=1 Tax=Mercurialis annua TaxID=3986 RepID=UPI00215EABAA|nr:serine/threonine-protein kinase ATG1a isoform X2 [Mercurialis annua]
MDHHHHHHTRFVGEYILGRKIGSGSFADVWLSRHRSSGVEVAVKEINKKSLSSKVSQNLLKEISILSKINHPNIVRLFESLESEDKIYLVLEYCGGGDLAAYIQRRGKISQAVAKHFMRQLAAGLQVLQENHLIHRDLKPQNLLLSSNDETPRLKIGDFGFARSLTPQDLADTLCGSPLYMAPEIIQNQKYDAKADLWSVGAILFQLVTGKPPFGGNSQYQLFQNILTSTELRFPQGALEELHQDCVDLCRKLLRQNPVERLTFNEFFNHEFLGEPRLEVDFEQASLPREINSVVDQFHSSGFDKRSQLHLEHPIHVTSRNATLSSSSAHDNIVHGRRDGSTSGTKSVHGFFPNIAHKSVDGSQCLSVQPRVADSVESIEKDYVRVNQHFASIDNFSYYSETSGQENPVIHGSDLLTASHASTTVTEVQEPYILPPAARLHLLNQYVQAVAELAQEKHSAGLFVESFSVELVVLAIWKKALQISSSWLASTAECELPESSLADESNHVRSDISDEMNLGRPSSACKWAEQEFVAACDRAEKLSYHIAQMDAAAEMPDAMEIIFQKAIDFGTSGAVDEYMENKGSAAISYSKATLLLSFVAEEAELLPLNPPFLLTDANKKRIQNYIMNLQSRKSHF